MSKTTWIIVAVIVIILSILAAIGKTARRMILAAALPPVLAEAITRAYHEMAKRSRHKALSVAVRSSATAEDLPEASFAD